MENALNVSACSPFIKADESGRDQIGIVEAESSVSETANLIEHSEQEIPTAYRKAIDQTIRRVVLSLSRLGTAVHADKETASQLCKSAVLLSLSRVAPAMQGIVNGIVARNLNTDQMAAVPLAIASSSGVMLIVQGTLMSTEVFVAKLNGAGQYF